MDLARFHESVRSLVAEEMESRRYSPEAPYPVEELVHAEIVMQHLQSAGLCESFEICYWSGKVGQTKLRVTGYALSSDESRLDLFITHYFGTDELHDVLDSEARSVAQGAFKFLVHSANGKLLPRLDQANDVYELVEAIQQLWKTLDQVRIFVITDGRTKSKHFKPQEFDGRSILVEAIDVERLYRHMSGKPREEIEIHFTSAIGQPLPCVYVPDQSADYEYALTAIPGEVVRALYERHNTRLLEANVRTFLGARGKVNKGIAATLANEPEHFMAFNNGLVVVCDDAKLVRCDDGSPGIESLRGLQIVNGGQTTSSLYFAKRDRRNIDLGQVRVPAKIIVLRDRDDEKRDRLVAYISKYANSQNSVKSSDLSANRPFHVQLEKLSQEQWCPDGEGRWFYERAAGSYNVMLLREGVTPAQRKKLQAQTPTKRKLTKNDVAKYHEAWRRLPAQVALGSEKNFAAFMEALDEDPSIVPSPLTDEWYRALIAKVILFKTIEGMIKTKEAKKAFRQGYVNIATYLVAVVADRCAGKFDFEYIWRHQALSEAFRKLLYGWATTVNKTFETEAAGRQFSEVAKREDLWPKVRAARYQEPSEPVPELAV